MNLWKGKSYEICKRIFCLLLILTVLVPRVTCFAYNEINPRWDYYLSITIVSDGDGILSSITDYTGHAFLIIRNDSTIPITVGHMQIPAETAITIGTFGNRSTYDGIWYNIEGYLQAPSSGTAATYSVPYNDLSTLNSIINSNDTHSDLFYNCASFARDVWNAVVPSSYQVSGNIPGTLEDSINSLDISTTSYSIPTKTINDIAYQTASSITYSTLGAYRH